MCLTEITSGGMAGVLVEFYLFLFFFHDFFFQEMKPKTRKHKSFLSRSSPLSPCAPPFCENVCECGDNIKDDFFFVNVLKQQVKKKYKKLCNEMTRPLLFIIPIILFLRVALLIHNTIFFLC